MAYHTITYSVRYPGWGGVCMHGKIRLHCISSPLPLHLGKGPTGGKENIVNEREKRFSCISTTVNMAAVCLTLVSILAEHAPSVEEMFTSLTHSVSICFSVSLAVHCAHQIMNIFYLLTYISLAADSYLGDQV